MSTKRFIGSVLAVFLVSQVFAIMIHGFILGLLPAVLGDFAQAHGRIVQL